MACEDLEDSIACYLEGSEVMVPAADLGRTYTVSGGEPRLTNLP